MEIEDCLLEIQRLREIIELQRGQHLETLENLAAAEREIEKLQAQVKHLESLLPRSMRARPWEGL